METDFFAGHKTTFSAVAAIVCGVAGLVFGFLESGVALLLITSGLGFFGLAKKVERE